MRNGFSQVRRLRPRRVAAAGAPALPRSPAPPSPRPLPPPSPPLSPPTHCTLKHRRSSPR
eukprot:7388936-Prymnesium_polylepis.1